MLSKPFRSQGAEKQLSQVRVVGGMQTDTETSCSSAEAVLSLLQPCQYYNYSDHHHQCSSSGRLEVFSSSCFPTLYSLT